jgi:hypothetical protein
MRNTILLAAMAAVMLLSAAAQAQPRMEFDLGFGYSHLHLSGSDRFKNRDGARIEPRFSIAPFSELRPLRFGFGLGMSSYSHELDDDVTITIDDGDEIHIIRADQWETVSLVSPEFQLSWRQPLDGRGRFFLEPGVAVGPVFANYAVYDEYWWGDDDDDDDDHESEWDTTFGVRPFLRLGYQEHWYAFGLEASYMFGGSVDLTDQVQGDVQELFLGGFFGFRF